MSDTTILQNSTHVIKPKKSVALSGVPAGNTALCTVGKSGMTLLPEEKVLELYGRRVLIMHGDTLCPDAASRPPARRPNGKKGIERERRKRGRRKKKGLTCGPHMSVGPQFFCVND